MVSRRHLLTALGTTTVAASLSQPACSAAPPAPQCKTVIPKRTLGKTGHLVTPLALGGQGALQRTPDGTDGPDIIVRAVELGVNYLDSANAYGTSQSFYGEAFRRLDLVPGRPGYDAALRERLYIASKTTRRFARNPADKSGPMAVDELKTSMTQMFGDGQGAVPEGAYLDCMQMHAINGHDEVDRLYLGMRERGGRMPDQIGAFAALLDYRDGTNFTGLNPGHKRWIRHIGISGHNSSPVLMRALRLDEGYDIDTLLVALNVLDKQYLPHQTNVVPLAVARGMGVIGMKVFADGAFFGREPRWARGHEDTVTTVGAPGALDYRALVRYTMSLPGVCCAVIGIGHIDRKDPSKDQLVADLAAAVDEPMGQVERDAFEKLAAARYGATLNYFQAAAQGLVQPTEIKLASKGDMVMVSWQAGYAGARPIRSWLIRSGGKTLLTLPFRPQLTMAPLFTYVEGRQIANNSVEVIASET